ncbi:MAG: hypothetical protein A2481_02410 [Candidatus Yonathbacteria bacterium RIFOXYC2_FULL_47_9]|nr:MAG: hypothetical protein A2481_02410 [Candidatus Yonathbacteria bacterium RIFOXYC2_FULL_47_9]HAT68551.1 hypothetical protein [Candidatus Yonathbacteria bacterium]
MPKTIQIQLPDNLSHWFGQQVYLTRGLNNSVRVASVEKHKETEKLIGKYAHEQMPDQPRMAEFLLAGTTEATITNDGIISLHEGLSRHLGSASYQTVETPEGLVIKRLESF